MTSITIRRLTPAGIYATAVLTAAAVMFPAPADAAPTPTDPTAQLNKIIGNATGWLVGILAALATLFLTIGGFHHVMAGGDPGQIEKAKGAYKSAAVGYALAALAPLVLAIIKGILGVS